jgi:hypothetical protein
MKRTEYFMIQSLEVLIVPSYAGITGGARPKTSLLQVPGTVPGVVGVGDGVGHQAGRGEEPGADLTGGIQLGARRGLNTGNRGRSPSVKRLRGNDGSPVDVTERSGSKPPQKKCVVGTSNNALQTTRKMRSPPADIFVWGIHPDTSLPDIVADLAESGIIIQERDIEKKSKEEAYLVSYKIRLKAEDLQKALEPSVWPLRVKVREFIYYSRRNPRQQRQQHEDGQEQDQQHGRGHGQQQGRGQQAGGGQGEQGELSIATNRYALPGEQVPGGPKV